MKHLLTLALLLVSTLSLAQFTPYNPDADNDQFVGAQDLLAFLPLFGEDWNLDSLTIYGTSDLSNYSLCGSSYNCGDGWLEVPQDADIIVYEDHPENLSWRLILPEVPRPMIVFGGGSMYPYTYLYSYTTEAHESIGRHSIQGVNGEPRATVLIPFNGKYWVIAGSD